MKLKKTICLYLTFVLLLTGCGNRKSQIKGNPNTDASAVQSTGKIINSDNTGIIEKQDTNKSDLGNIENNGANTKTDTDTPLSDNDKNPDNRLRDKMLDSAEKGLIAAGGIALGVVIEEYLIGRENAAYKIENAKLKTANADLKTALADKSEAVKNRQNTIDSLKHIQKDRWDERNNLVDERNKLKGENALLTHANTAQSIVIRALNGKVLQLNDQVNNMIPFIGGPAPLAMRLIERISQRIRPQRMLAITYEPQEGNIEYNLNQPIPAEDSANKDEETSKEKDSQEE